MDNSRVYSSMNMVSKVRAAISPVKEATTATHMWTKLHNEVMSWISDTYECHYAWFLPEANSTTVRSVQEQPALICHGPQSQFALAHVQIWNPSYPFVQFKF